MDSCRYSLLTRLWIERSRNRGSIPGRGKSVHSVQTGFEAHTAGTGDLAPWLKPPGLTTHLHLVLSVRIHGAVSPLPHTS
jgi:hypothetical protein